MSTTGNIILVPRQQQLRLRPRWRLRLRRGAASAANDFHQSRTLMGIRPIGEQVRRLRNSCTGPAPVHFFVKAAGVAVLLAAAPLSSAHAAAPPAALIGAANTPSLSAYVRDLGWMNPIYGELRHALANHAYASDHERQLLSLNLERARTLPAGKQRYILVNAAQQRLYTYEDGK